MNKTVPNTTNAPLRVFIPNILVPQAALDRLDQQRKSDTFAGLPRSLLQAMARTAVAQTTPVAQLDRVEAWLLSHLDFRSEAKFDQYPAWAMMNAEGALPYTRFWASVGCLEVERDGVRFSPGEVLQVSQSDLRAFWNTVHGTLAGQGWVQTSPEGLHCLLHNTQPVPMEQPSPWSVQGIRLTDYLPMGHDCSAWRRMWLNMQVELHNAEFNKARESRGLKPLNALWFWGGGSPWQASAPMPSLKSVSADGLFDAVKLTDGAGDAVNRFVFWSRLLGALEAASDPELFEERGSPCTVYCLDFEGWGSSVAAFAVLEQEVLEPMRMAGLAVEWDLMGQHSWRTLRSNWTQRFKFWKNTPDWNHLGEPEPDGAPTEADLQAAWQQGQRDQDHIQAEWEGRA